MTNRGKWVLAAVLLAAGIVSGVLLGGGKNGAGRSAGMGMPRPMPVEAAPVARARAVREAETVGTLQADESVVIRAEIAGRLSAILFAEGQRVEEGDDLVNIDPAELDAQVRQSAASVELSRMNFDRARQLHAEKMISQQGYDEIATRLKESEANFALVQARLAKTRIRAPFSGRLGLRQVVTNVLALGAHRLPRLAALRTLGGGNERFRSTCLAAHEAHAGPSWWE